MISSHRSRRDRHATHALAQLGGLLRHRVHAGRGQGEGVIRERLQLDCRAAALLRLSASVGAEHCIRMMQEKAFCEVKHGVFLKLYKHDNLEPFGKEVDDKSDSSGATTSEKEGDPKGKERASLRARALPRRSIPPWTSRRTRRSTSGTGPSPRILEHRLLREAVGQGGLLPLFF